MKRNYQADGGLVIARSELLEQVMTGQARWRAG